MADKTDTAVETTTATKTAPETGSVVIPATETVVEQPEKKPAATVEELRAENARLAKELTDRNKEEAGRRKKLEALEKAEQERADAAKSELQKAQERAAAAEAKAKAAELAVARRDVVAEVKLPPELADFLQGETPEELRASAEKLLKSLPAKSPPPPGPVHNPGNGPVHTGETDEEKRKRIFGR
jgi:Skp family chaperone for outer membrane proteins